MFSQNSKSVAELFLWNVGNCSPIVPAEQLNTGMQTRRPDSVENHKREMTFRICGKVGVEWELATSSSGDLNAGEGRGH